MSEETLWELFLNDEVEDLQTILLMGGVNDLMENFTSWLYENELIDRNNLTRTRDHIRSERAKNCS